jgi:hypothetical protein
MTITSKYDHSTFPEPQADLQGTSPPDIEGRTDGKSDFAAMAKMVPVELRKPSGAPAVIGDPRPIRAYYDVLGDPVTIVVNADGQEAALHYLAAQKSHEVPVDWVRTLGDEIDLARFDGLLLAKYHNVRTSVVAMHPDGIAGIIVTPKTVVSNIREQGWRTGLHFTPAEIQTFERVEGTKAEAILAESQAALRHPRVQKEADRVGPGTRVLATGGGRTLVIDDNGARSHVGDRWVPGIQFSNDVIATMRPITDLAEKGRHLRFVEFGDAIGTAMCNNLNSHVMERYGGIYEDNLPGFPRHGYSDSEIAESKRVAAETVARAARID